MELSKELSNHLRTYDERIAAAHGINAALVHEEIRRWCAYNTETVQDDTLIDGRVWCYLSAQRIADHHSYISIATVKRSLKTLTAAGLLHKRHRAGTGLDNGNPTALLYHAVSPVDKGGVKSVTSYQNDPTPGIKMIPPTQYQNDTTERRVLKNVVKERSIGPRWRAAPRDASAPSERGTPLPNSINPNRTTQPPSPVSETPKAAASDSVKVMSAEATQPPTTFDEVPVTFHENRDFSDPVFDPVSDTETNYEKQKRVVDGGNLHQPTAVDTTETDAQNLRDELTDFLSFTNRNIPHAFQYEANVLINTVDDLKVLKRGPDTLSALKLCPVKEMTEAAG